MPGQILSFLHGSNNPESYITCSSGYIKVLRARSRTKLLYQPVSSVEMEAKLLAAIKQMSKLLAGQSARMN